MATETVKAGGPAGVGGATAGVEAGAAGVEMGSADGAEGVVSVDSDVAGRGAVAAVPDEPQAASVITTSPAMAPANGERCVRVAVLRPATRDAMNAYGSANSTKG